ncbi:MAG: hypothetical protein ACYTBJ_00225 [Planctomycetota bacterium]|jgi:hypothetical protein
MNIDELTIGEVKHLASLLGSGGLTSSVPQHDFEVGKSYFIRTVTHHYLGTVQKICELCIVMDACVWVPDDGRFHKLMQGCWDESSEREPYVRGTPVQVFFGAMLDASEWSHAIPAEVK